MCSLVSTRLSRLWRRARSLTAAPDASCSTSSKLPQPSAAAIRAENSAMQVQYYDDFSCKLLCLPDLRRIFSYPQENGELTIGGWVLIGANSSGASLIKGPAAHPVTKARILARFALWGALRISAAASRPPLRTHARNAPRPIISFLPNGCSHTVRSAASPASAASDRGWSLKETSDMHRTRGAKAKTA